MNSLLFSKHAYFCREEDIPTYGFLSLSVRFYFMPTLFNSALKTAPHRKPNELK